MSEAEKSIHYIIKAIAGLEKTQEITTKNVDKLVSNMEKLIPIHEELKNLGIRITDLEDESKQGVRPSTLKSILISVGFVLLSFGTWVTIFCFNIDKELSNHKTLSMEIQKQQQEDIQDTKNQITYVKGRIK